jgi:hypothetical protein
MGAIDQRAIAAIERYFDSMPARGTPEYRAWLARQPQMVDKPGVRWCSHCWRDTPCEACEDLERLP